MKSRDSMMRSTPARPSSRLTPAQLAPSRRQLLGVVVSAPLLLEALQGPSVPGALAAEQAEARFLTPAQQAAVDAAFNSTMTKGKAPVCLRLVFHDFGPHRASVGGGGLNASIQFELDRPENFGLKRGWRVIQATMAKLKGTAAEGAVSYADLVALGGAHAVRMTGGPTIQVPVGRRDALEADPVGRMPPEDASAVQQLEIFAEAGLSPREFLVLCGGHTLGGKGYGDPLAFDNTYYTTLLQKPWADKSNSMNQHIGIPTDHVLPEDPTCLPIIKEYAADQGLFFRDFATAYVKATSLGVEWV
ncbi:hypothetical protein N2152v2_007336 [Parachlorella kessleri]